MREQEFEFILLNGCLITKHEERRSLAYTITAGYISQRSLSYLTWIKKKMWLHHWHWCVR